jgi:hypothetical protein
MAMEIVDLPEMVIFNSYVTNYQRVNLRNISGWHSVIYFYSNIFIVYDVIPVFTNWDDEITHSPKGNYQ